MKFTRLWRFIRGYVIIRVEGRALEKCINRALAEGLLLWDVHRVSYGVMTLCVSRTSLGAYCALCQELGLRIHVEKRAGIFFILAPLRARWMLSAGLVLCIGALLVAAQFIWEIDVSGCPQAVQQQVLSVLAREGMHKGMYRHSIDTHTLRDTLMIQVPSMTWMAVEVRGVRLVVQAHPEIPAPEIFPRGQSAHIVSTQDAVIESVLPLAGTARVVPGQLVKRGTLLIEGVGNANEPELMRPVRALGHVFAKIWYQGEAQLDLEAAAFVRTGRSVSRRYMLMGSWVIPMGAQDVPFEHYDIEQTRYASAGQQFFLPVYVVREQCYEMTSQPEMLDMERLQQEALKVAKAQAEAQIPEGVSVIEEHVQSETRENKLIVRYTATTRQEIGETVPFDEAQWRAEHPVPTPTPAG
nr:sporulation protein YqfD [Maliibacterium massiliense]